MKQIHVGIRAASRVLDILPIETFKCEAID